MYPYDEDNNLNLNDSGSDGENGAVEPEDSEYRIVRPDSQRPAWRDAEFTPQEESTVPPRYHIPEQKKTREKKAKEKSAGMSFPKVASLCLACALVGGVAGGVATHGLLANEAPGGTANGGTVISSAPPVSSPSVNKLSSGTLTGNEIYELGLQQVVGITTEITTTNIFGQTSSGSVTGSGFIITDTGYILTNYHVVEDAYKGGYEVTVMLNDGTAYTAEIVGFEKDNDVAVLKVEASGLTPVAIGNSDSLSVGDTVYAVGNPLGELAYSMTSGIVSATDRLISTYDANTRTTTSIYMFQIDAAVNEGNSGGPVYNDRGEVIGIVSAKYSQTGVEGLGFAIPINDAVDIANDIIANGYVTGKASMGITVQNVSASAAQYYNMATGAYVFKVEPESSAEAAGLKIGDIITKMDGVEIASSDELKAAVRTHKAGETVDIEVWRSGEYLTLTITFGEEVPETEAEPSPTPESQPMDIPESGQESFPFIFPFEY